MPVLAVPYLVPFANAAGIVIGSVASAVGLIALSDKVQDYMEENPENSMKILAMIMPEQGIAALFNKEAGDEVEGEEVEGEEIIDVDEEKPKSKKEIVLDAVRKAKRGKGNYASPDAEGNWVSGRGSVIRGLEDAGKVDKGLKDKPYKKSKFNWKRFTRNKADGGRIGFDNGGDLSEFKIGNFRPLKYTGAIDDIWESEELGSDPLSVIVKMGLTVRAPLIDVIRNVAKTSAEAAKLIAAATKMGWDLTKPARDIIGDVGAAGLEGTKWALGHSDKFRWMTKPYLALRMSGLNDAEARLNLQDTHIGEFRKDKDLINKLENRLMNEKVGESPDQISMEEVELYPGRGEKTSRMSLRADGGRIGFEVGGLSSRAQGIYDSWIAAGHTEEDVLAYLTSQGLYGDQEATGIETIVNTAPAVGGGDGDFKGGGKWGNLDLSKTKTFNKGVWEVGGPANQYGSFVDKDITGYYDPKQGNWKTFEGKNIEHGGYLTGEPKEGDIEGTPIDWSSIPMGAWGLGMKGIKGIQNAWNEKQAAKVVEAAAKRQAKAIELHKAEQAQKAADAAAGAFTNTVQLDPGGGGGPGSPGSWHGQTAAKERQGQQVAGPGFGQGAYFEDGGLATMFQRRR